MDRVYLLHTELLSELGPVRKTSGLWGNLLQEKNETSLNRASNVFHHFIKDSWKAKAIEMQGMKY